MRELTLYSRPGCHLCDFVFDELQPLCTAGAVSLRVIDVDSDPALRERYGLRVPVVCAGDTELCGWPFDQRRISDWLRASGPG